MFVMTSVLLVLIFAALAAIYLYSRDTDRRNRAWHLLSLLTGRRPPGPADELSGRDERAAAGRGP
jgi:hypothetical protein